MIGAVASGLIAAGSALATFSAKASETISAMAALQQKFQLSATAMNGFTFLAERFGVSQGDLSHALGVAARHFGDLKEQLTSGTGEAARTLERLGISAGQFVNMRFEDKLLAVADALKNIRDPAERAALAHAVLGRSAEELEPLLRRGSEGFAEAAEQARRYHTFVSTADAAKVREAGKAVSEAGQALKASVEAVANSVAIFLAPVVRELATYLTNTIVSIHETVDGLNEIRNMIPFLQQVQGVTMLPGQAPISLGDPEQELGAASHALIDLREHYEDLRLTMGMTADEAAIANVQWFGATASMVNEMQQLQQAVAAIENFNRANDAARNAVTQWKSLADTFGMTARQAEIFRASQAGVNSELVQTLRLRDQELTTLEATAAAAQQAQQRQAQLTNTLASAIASGLNAAPLQHTGPRALLEGSADALSLINQSSQSAGGDPAERLQREVERQTEILRRNEALMRDIRAAIDRQGALQVFDGR